MSIDTRIEAPASRFQRISNLLLALCLGAMALVEIVQRTPLDLGHDADVE